IAVPGGSAPDGRRVQFALRASHRDQLDAAGGELRGAALVGVDVGVGMTEDAVIRLAEGGQGKGVGGGAGVYEGDIAVGLKEVAQPLGSPCRPVVVAVGEGVTPVRFFPGFPGLGTDAGGGV